MECQEFVRAESTASLVHGENPANLHVGDFVMLKGKPCKIMEESVCKTGKHGHAKYAFTGIDIFTGKKCVDCYMGHDSAEVPEVTRYQASLVDISDDGYLFLMMENLETRNDIALPVGELGESIKKAYGSSSSVVVVIQSAMDIEAVIDFKVVKNL